MKRILLFLLFSSFFATFPILLVAQRANQTIKGVVTDKTTKQPLVGATITLPSTNPMKGATTDAEGYFKIEKVPVGRYTIKAQFVGYEDVLLDFVEVKSAIQTELNIELREKTGALGDVTVTANRKNEPLNEMSVVSTRSFSVGETERYAATINDPSRLAASFAGVQTTQDNNNDIVVRGNSSVGVLWRLEGVDIPNPNHFARPASSGGGISAFSAALLANSDFSSGAFAAEYGNALSAVFDMKFRHGNTEQNQYRAKLGLIGLELGAEGPFKKRESSYLVNYRYSTLGVLSKLGFNFVSERTTDVFQDLSFNLFFPQKDHKGEYTVFGFGGNSIETHELAKSLRSLVVDPSKSYSQSDRSHSIFKTNLAVLGATHTRLIDAKSFLKTTLSLMWSENSVVNDTLNNHKTFDITGNHIAKDTRLALASHYSRKMSPSFTLKAGLNASIFAYDVLKDRFGKQGRELWIDADGSTSQLDVYAQGRWVLNPRLALLAGLHGLYFALNNSASIEPRAALQVAVNPNQSMTFAYGLHSRILPIGTYLTRLPVCADCIAVNLPLYPTNRDLKLAKAHHFVFSYDLGFAEHFRVHSEVYYQRLFNIPVSRDDLKSSYWMFNDSEGFGSRDMVSDGKGSNKGIDLTLEQFYARKFFFLATGSLFQSRYSIERSNSSLPIITAPTAYDNGYNMSLMGGKEFAFRSGSILQIGTRLMRSGGNRFTPPDVAESKKKGYYVPDDAHPFAEQVPDYFRIDGRVSYMKNRAHYHYTLSLDMFNMTNRANPSSQYFDSTKGIFVYNTQSTFTPVLSWEIHF